MLAKRTFFLYYLPLPCLLPSLPQVTTSYQAGEGQWVDSCESCAFHVNMLPLSIHVFISSFILINYLFQNYTRADLDINHKYIIFFIQVLKIYIFFCFFKLSFIWKTYYSPLPPPPSLKKSLEGISQNSNLLMDSTRMGGRIDSVLYRSIEIQL